MKNKIMCTHSEGNLSWMNLGGGGGDYLHFKNWGKATEGHSRVMPPPIRALMLRARRVERK